MWPLVSHCGSKSGDLAGMRMYSVSCGTIWASHWVEMADRRCAGFTASALLVLQRRSMQHRAACAPERCSDTDVTFPLHFRLGLLFQTRIPMGKGRLEAFSDGVIAVIITIMVLEMKVPHGIALPALLPLIPVFLSYVLSFVF